MSFMGRADSISREEVVNVSVGEQQEPVGNRSSELIAAAREAVKVLADAIGLPEDKLSVTISGHANIDGSAVEGWSDEFIMVNVSVGRG